LLPGIPTKQQQRAPKIDHTKIGKLLRLLSSDKDGEVNQPDHRANLADSIAQETRIWFSVHTGWGEAQAIRCYAARPNKVCDAISGAVNAPDFGSLRNATSNRAAVFAAPAVVGCSSSRHWFLPMAPRKSTYLKLE
jgi:hypothetical protein